MTPTKLLNVRVDDERKRKWQEAADKAEVSLSVWIRSACDAFAVGGVIVKVNEREVAASVRANKAFKGPDPKPVKSRR